MYVVQPYAQQKTAVARSNEHVECACHVARYATALHHRSDNEVEGGNRGVGGGVGGGGLRARFHAQIMLTLSPALAQQHTIHQMNQHIAAGNSSCGRARQGFQVLCQQNVGCRTHMLCLLWPGAGATGLTALSSQKKAATLSTSSRLMPPLLCMPGSL